ncbi:hypothetical protein SAMN05421810_111210 [Amycolatopsis arida]|uniref:Transmembrane protein n=1 Tax=Amycolatopsis arida TaxID=587909 RepID=A0A1I6A9T4_9PSEU|nr:hypothetical protein [Amycolatopsis arida]TDX88485.1 hypothetical protein CLV69_1113 [Amycolatopsis arida]SFQ65506.1 hypothetical protein SAMN05421810_111210 [Amycolatopsis arida]
MSDVAGAPAWPGAAPNRDRLHQPWRSAVALVEVVLAAGAGWLATVSWSTAVTPVVTRLADGTELASTHYAGNWVAMAIGLGTLAGLLVIDAVRQLLLAVRAPRRSRRRRHLKKRD